MDYAIKEPATPLSNKSTDRGIIADFSGNFLNIFFRG
jgi:hypothetical protein